MMVDLSTYPFLNYIPNQITAYVFSLVVCVLLIVWLIQSIQNHFQPIRLIILLCFAHLTIIIELIIRATSNTAQRKTQVFYMVMTILYTIGQRSIIIANFISLNQHSEKKSNLSRWIFLGISLSILLSDILMAPVGFLSFQSDKIHLSFLFRQISTCLICLITILFYFIWFWTRVYSSMSYELIILLTISNFNSIIITIFLVIMSFPQYYMKFNDDEQWFYFFQILPILLTLCTWSLLHPKRSFHFRNRFDIVTEIDEKKFVKF
jgi:hypothetical protein